MFPPKKQRSEFLFSEVIGTEPTMLVEMWSVRRVGWVLPGIVGSFELCCEVPRQILSSS